MPAAPALFSTTTACFQTVPSASAMMRGRASAVPPAGLGTMILTVADGKGSAALDARATIEQPGYNRCNDQADGLHYILLKGAALPGAPQRPDVARRAPMLAAYFQVHRAQMSGTASGHQRRDDQRRRRTASEPRRRTRRRPAAIDGRRRRQRAQCHQRIVYELIDLQSLAERALARAKCPLGRNADLIDAGLTWRCLDALDQMRDLPLEHIGWPEEVGLERTTDSRRRSHHWGQIRPASPVPAS